MTLGIEREGLAEPLRALVASGTPTLGTCAGMIMLDRDHLGVLDVASERNAFGRQSRASRPPRVAGIGEAGAGSLHPRAVGHEPGDGVEVLAEVDGHPVAVRQDDVLAVAFHPELTGDTRLHEWLVERTRDGRRTDA